MKKAPFILALALLPTVGLAAEKFTATNYYVTESHTWPTTQKTGYWMVRFTGVSQVSQGPVETLGVECNGAGFWGADGISGNGICVHGTGDDTFVLRWDTQPGATENTWRILGGTGKYENLQGQGTATTQRLPGNRRISRLEGEVQLTK